MTDIADTEEFVKRPSEITKHLVNIVLSLNEKYEKSLQTKDFIKKFLFIFRIQMYLKSDYLDFYSFLKGYRVPACNVLGPPRLEFLFKEFEQVYERLIFHNFAIAYAYAASQELSHEIFTMEDRKVLFLKKIFHNEMTREAFMQEFGHCALNTYELSSQRFEEYSDQELLSIARLVSNLKIRERPSLEEYMGSKPKKITPVLIALRELAKYKVQFLVRDIRYELLQLAKDRDIKDIFNKTYAQIMLL